MFRRRGTLLILLSLSGLLGGWWLCSRNEPKTSAATRESPQASRSATSPAFTPSTAPNLDGPTTSHEPRRAFQFPGARVLEEHTLGPDATGLITRVKVLQTRGQYPLVRMVETHREGIADSTERAAMVADHVTVKLSAGHQPAELTAWAKTHGLKPRRSVGADDLFLLELPSPDVRDFDVLLQRLNDDPARPIDYAEPDYLRFAASVLNDTRFAEQWALHNTGQTGGTPDADVDAPEAWDISRGSASVIVAVIDTGIDLPHPDLAGNLWTNPGEVAGNNVDDDGNGRVDDIHGWNFVYDDGSPPQDQEGHGTHCAGVIGALGDNAVGITGICPQVRLMALKAIDDEGYIAVSSEVAALNYATDKGAKICSMSFGGSGPVSTSEKNAIIAAGRAGVLLVCAAGNDWTNIDAHPSYPASFNYSNIIAVAASGHRDSRAAFSNYGPVAVDLAAPGVGILSTLPGGTYGYESGTSMSTPLVAGACALLSAHQPSLDYAAIKSAILSACDPVAALVGQVRTGGRLNVARALKIGNGPFIEVTKASIADGKSYGAKGNADRIINAGEDITLTLTIRNGGPLSAAGVVTTAAITTGSDAVSLIKSSKSWGTVASKASLTNTTTPLVLRVAAGVLTDTPFTIQLTHRDTAGRAWSEDLSFTITASPVIAGRVSTLTGDKAIASAAVTYTGPVTGKVTTGKDGRYSVKLPSGTYTLTATVTGYEPASLPAITIPADALAADFRLGRGRLTVAPASLSATQAEGVQTHHALALANTGDLPVRVEMSASHMGFTMAATASQLAPWWNRDTTLLDAFVDPDLGALTGLPYEHGFETTTLSGWSAAKYYGYWFGHYSLPVGGAARGNRSLYQWGFGEPAGLAHAFASSGVRSSYLSVWVKPGTSMSRVAAVALEGLSADEYGYPIYLPIVSARAVENGFFHAGPADRAVSTARYVPLRWYRLEFRSIDWVSGHYDFYVDGVLADAGVPFEYSMPARRVRLYNESEGDAWWDEVVVGGGNGTDWLRPDAAPVVIAPGATVSADVMLDTTNGRPGKYLGAVEISSNDPITPRTKVPVTMTVTVNETNTTPIAGVGRASVEEDVKGCVQLPATDAENDPIAIMIETLPARGKLYQTTDGVTPGAEITQVPALLRNLQRKVFYAAPPNANGTSYASVQFTARDWRSASASRGTLTIDVTPVNDPPEGLDDAFFMAGPGTTHTTAVLANDFDLDGDLLHVSSVTQPAHGVAVINADSTLSYTPDAGFGSGTDEFTYTGSDQDGASYTQTVRVTVGLLAGSWPTARHDAGHTGYVRGGTAGASFTQQWSVTGDVMSGWAPVVGAGRVLYLWYVPTTGAIILRALDTATGGWVWQFPASDEVKIGQPLIADGKVYLSGQSGSQCYVWALNAATGAVLWTYAFSSQFALDSSPLPAPVLDVRGLHAVVRNSVLRTITLNPVTGERVDSYGSQPPTRGGDLLLGQGFAAVQSSGYLDGCTLSDWATRTWNYQLRGAYGGYACVGPRVVGWDRDEKLAVLRPSGTSAEQQWTQSGYFPQASVADDAVYAATESVVNVYSLRGGALLRSYPLSATAGLIASLDTLFAHKYDGSLQVADVDTGTVRQSIPGVMTFVVAENSVFVTKDGAVARYVLNNPANTAPTASSVAVTTAEDTPVVLSLTGADTPGSTLSRVITRLPLKGTLYQTNDGVTPSASITSVPAFVTHGEGKLIYVPVMNENGAPYASLDFRVSDGALLSGTATVTIQVTAVPDAPRANADIRYAPLGEPITGIWPTDNDFDADGDSLTITSFTQPAHGVVIQNGDGSLTYTPTTSAVADETFEYTISDPTGRTSSSTVTIRQPSADQLSWTTTNGHSQPTRHYFGKLGSALVKRWSAAGTNIASYMNGALVASQGRLYSTGDALAARDASTGAILWSSLDGNFVSLATTSGHVFAATYSGTDWRLFAFYGAAGTPEWNVSMGALDYRNVIANVAPEGIYSNRADGSMWRFDFVTGQPSVSFTPHPTSWDKLTISHGRAYAITGSELTCWDSTTGAKQWSVPAARARYGANVPEDEGRLFVEQADPPGVLCLDSANGAALWQTDTPKLSEGIYPANGTLYLAGNGVISTYAAQSGEWTGDIQIGGSGMVSVPHVVAEDVLLVADPYTGTRVYDRHTRQWVQTLAERGVTIAMDGRIFIAGYHGLVCYAAAVPGNAAPVATAQTIPVNEAASTSVTLNATDTNNQALRYVIRTLPALGKLYQTSDGVTRGAAITIVPALVSAPAGSVIYEAPTDVMGSPSDPFVFAAHDGIAFSADTTITMQVANVNDPPQAVDDTVVLSPGQSFVEFHPQLNDRDTDGELLSIARFTQPARGQVTTATGGALRYTPNGGVTSGTDLFTYTVRDAEGVESSASIEVLIGSRLGLDWTTTQASSAHNAYMPVELGTTPLTLSWTKAIVTRDCLPPIAVNGRVFVQMTSNAYLTEPHPLVALDPATGNQLWSRSFTGGGLMGPPTWINGKLIVQDVSNQQLRAVAESTGAVAWSASCPPMNNYGYPLAPVAMPTAVFVAGKSATSGKGALQGFNLASGARLFTTAAAIDWQFSTPSVQGQSLIAASSDALQSYASADGHQEWSLTLTPTIMSYDAPPSVSVAKGFAYSIFRHPEGLAGFSFNMLGKVDLATHTLVWQVPGGFGGTPVIAHGLVFVTSGAPSSIQAYDAQNGALVASYSTGGQSIESPIAVTNDVLVARSTNDAVIFDLRSHTIIQTVTNGRQFCISGTNLFVASDYGQVRCFSKATSTPAPPPAMAQHASAPQASAFTIDSDHDGQSDAAEALAGTNANDAADVFHTCGCETLADGQHVRISWAAKAGHNYVVECSSDLKTWSAVSATLPSTAAAMHFDAPVSGTRCFLRVRLVP